MIKGISYLSFENGLSNNEPIESALSETKMHGFDALELSVSSEGVISTNSSKAECEMIRKRIDDSGVFVDSIATGMSWGVSPTSDDESIRKKIYQSSSGRIKSCKLSRLQGFAFCTRSC